MRQLWKGTGYEIAAPIEGGHSVWGRSVGYVGGKGGVDRNRLRLFLASSSFAAILVGTGTPPAWAAVCSTNEVGVSVASVSNSGPINCINIQNSTVTDNVTNTGTITTGSTAPTKTGITINNASIGGAVVNNGSITSKSGQGILIDNNATISGGISNSGTISAGVYVGILLSSVTAFGSSAGGGITNSGLISGGTKGIYLLGVTTFSGGISNSGTISGGYTGIRFSSVTAFGSSAGGGITNSGTISAGDWGIYLSGVTTFSGGIVNSAGGTISGGHSHTGIYLHGVSTFSGGISNAGLISGGAEGIGLWKVTTFSGDISNSGTISGGHTGIIISGGPTFSGGIVNSAGGTISGGSIGIWVSSVAQFGSTSAGGGITNSGLISGGTAGIYLHGVTTFSGGITNAGTISGGHTGIMVVGPMTTFGGGITNSGMISGHDYGIVISSVSTFNGGITNSGTITASLDAAIYVHNGVSIFLGGITNSGSGVLAAGSAGIAVYSGTTFSGGISNAGTISGGTYGIVVNDSGATFTGPISNNGQITAVGGIGIAVEAIGQFSQGITNSGTISGVTGILLTAEVSSFSGAISNSGNITGSGGTAINVSGAHNAITINQSGGTITGAIMLSANADVLNISGGVINGNIIGSGSLDTVNFNPGAGNTFTYGSSYGFSGINQVNINSGTVVLNGTNNATYVDVIGGTLEGTGTLDPLTLTIHSGATFAPGNGTPGSSMTITGNLVFQSGATYQINLNPTTASYATVSGTGSGKATVAGTVDANFASGSYTATQYTILIATGGVSGTFTPTIVNTNLPAGMSDKLTYGTDDVYLVLSPSTGRPTYSPVNVNEQNVASALINYFNSVGSISAQFFSLSPNALTQIDGEAATGAERGAFLEMDQFLELMLDPFVDGRSGAGWLSGGTATAINFAPDREASLPPDIALAYAGVLKAPPKPTYDQRWTTWAAGFGASNTSNGDPAIGSTNVTASDYGYAAGMDYHYSRDTVFGFALAGGGTNWGLADGLGGGRSDDFHAGVYGVTRSGPWYLAGALAFANHWMSTSRIALGDQLTASFTAQSYGARVEGGYRYATAVNNVPIGITPYGALRVETFNAPGYSETDVTSGGFGLTYGAMNATDTRSELGARFDSPTMLGNMPLVLRAELAWAHDWVSNPSLNAAFETLAGTNFTVYGAPFAKNLALTTAGAVLRITPNWSFAAKFEGEFAGGSETYGGTGTLRYRW